MDDLEVIQVTYRNSKRTNWETYWEDLTESLGIMPRVTHLAKDVQLTVDMVQQAILPSYQPKTVQLSWLFHKGGFPAGIRVQLPQSL
jgi:hypothetical protein